MNPKTTLLVCLLLAAVNVPAAVDFTQTFTPADGTIPEGNPVPEDFAGAITAAGSDQTVLSLSVSLNVTGGYDGDLTAFLVSPNNTRVTLLDQPGRLINGFGAGGAGLNVTLTDLAVKNIQDEISHQVLTGTFLPAQSLRNFENSPVNGTWRLFFADLGSGAGNATLNSWSLEIESVPEPGNYRAALLVAMMLVLSGWRSVWRKVASRAPFHITRLK